MGRLPAGRWDDGDTDLDELSVNQKLLHSLLLYDESLRSGRGLDPQMNSTDEDTEHFEVGCAALQELEAAIPRRMTVMPSWAPDRIGRFEIRSVLGAGGFAVVYLACDPTLNRLVALKIPRPHALIRPELRRRFVTEAQAAARLDHSNIVPVFEAGEDRDLPYIACAHCEGPTLAQWLSSRASTVNPKIAAAVVRDLANAVQYSHERGILHRDIKPGNVLLFPEASRTADAFPFVPRLSDFGLAKVLESDGLDTVTSQLMGTPRYMAPEMIRGRGVPGAVTPDIYALGALLYCMITGKPPFGSATAAETIRQIVDEEPIPPKTLDPATGKDLSLICLKCLQKAPEARYQTAAELSDELQRYLSGQPVKARPTRFPLRVQKWCQRRPGIATLLGTSAALAAALIVFSIHYTISLRALKSELITTNERLSDHVDDLDRTVQVSNRFQSEADSNRRMANSQVFAADLNLAHSLIRNGDIFAAQSVLKKYAKASDDPAAFDSDTSGHQSFAWRYLMNQTSRHGVTSPPSGQIVWDSQLSPTGDRLAVTGNRGIIRIMDPGNEFRVLKEREIAKTELNCLSWCQVAPILAVAGDDGLIRVCRTDNLQEIRTLEISPGTHVYAMSFQPGSTNIVVRGPANDLQIWDAATGVRTGTLTPPHTEEIEHLAISPDGLHVVTGSWDFKGKICCQEIRTGTVIWQQTVTGDLTGFISVVRYSPDQKYVVVSALKKSVVLLDAKSGQEIRRWNGLDRIHALAADETRVVCGNELGLLTELPIENESSSWQPKRQWQGHTTKVSSITLFPENRALTNAMDVISTDRSESEVRWKRDLPAFSKPYRPAEHHQSTNNRDAIRWKDDNTVFRMLTKSIERIDLTSGRTSLVYTGDPNLTSMQYSQAAKRLICSDDAGTIRVFDDAGHEVLQMSLWQEFGCSHVSLDATGALAMVGSSGHFDVVVVDLVSKSIRLRLTNREWSGISPDGRWLASASQQQDCIEIYEMNTLQKIATLTDIDPTYEAFAFSPDSQRLISAGSRRAVTVWDCRSWMLMSRFAVSSSSLRLPTFHPDGRTVAIAADDGEIALVDVAVGRELITLGQTSDRLISGLAFSPDGHQLAVCDGSLNLRIVTSPDVSF